MPRIWVADLRAGALQTRIGDRQAWNSSTPGRLVRSAPAARRGHAHREARTSDLSRKRCALPQSPSGNLGELPFCHHPQDPTFERYVGGMLGLCNWHLGHSGSALSRTAFLVSLGFGTLSAGEVRERDESESVGSGGRGSDHCAGHRGAVGGIGGLIWPRGRLQRLLVHVLADRFVVLPAAARAKSRRLQRFGVRRPAPGPAGRLGWGGGGLVPGHAARRPALDSPNPDPGPGGPERGPGGLGRLVLFLCGARLAASRWRRRC